MTTTVCCLFVRGHVPYTAEYVVRLAAMVKRWMDRPYRFVCLTDRAYMFKGSAGIDTIAVKPFPGLYAWWNKLHLFRADIGLQGRVLYLDLDTLVVGSLAPILDHDGVFALLPHEGKFDGKGPRRVVKRFNSSVMVWRHGFNGFIWDNFHPTVSERLWGDQDWIAEQCPCADMLPAEWFPRLSAIRGGPVPPEAKVILAKSPKNAEAARRWAWVRHVWRAA